MERPAPLPGAGEPRLPIRSARPRTAGHGRRLMLRLMALVAGAGLLAGCSVGPDYEAPEVTVPARWANGPSAASRAAPRLAEWWRNLGDPTLDALMVDAVAGNLDVGTAKANVRNARATYRQAVGALFPQVIGDASVVRGDSGGGRDGPFGEANTYTRYNAGLAASWEIDLFGGNRRNVEATIYGADAADDELSAVLLALVSDVATYYVEARGYQARIALARRTAASQRQTAAITRRMMELGSASAMDVANATGLAANTEAGIPRLETAYAQSVHRLSVLTGRTPATLAPRLAKGGPIPAARRKLPAGIPANVLSNRPDVRAAERNYAQATARIGVAEAARYPSVSLSGDLNTTGARPGDLARGSSISWAFGPSLTVPIFNAGQLAAAVEITEAQRDAAFLAFQSSVLVALEEVENALVALAKEHERSAKLALATSSYSDSLRLARELFENGSTSFLEVLNGERSLYSSEDSLLQSRVDITTYYISLAKALGGGWERPVDVTTPVIVDRNTGPHLSRPMPQPPPAPPRQPI